MTAQRRLRLERPPIHSLGTSLALACAVLVALGGLNQLLAGLGWWLGSAGIVLGVLATIAITRRASRRLALPLAAGAVALVVLMTLAFARDTAILGVIPTFSTIGTFGDLLSAGEASIIEQGVPAEAVPGIMFILAGSAGLVAIAVDALAIVARVPAVAGVPLLLVVAAPGFVDPDFTDAPYFVFTAAAWLLVVFVASKRVQPGVAFSVGAAAVVGALVLPILLPPVQPNDNQTAAPGYTTGLNPIIDLGSDLRRSAPVVAMTYTTTATTRQYLRMATLDEFSDGAWEPRIGSGDSEQAVEDIPAALGRGADVAVVASETSIEMGNVRGRWLPVPYAPRSVTGLVGSWMWDPETLNVRSVRSTVRGQEYTVASEEAAPTSDQLRAADPTITEELAPYVELPGSLPDIVVNEALAATAGANTNYDKAIALQSYFRGGAFTYSEDAPEEEGYDGTGARVIGTFLEEKSGYCVHFSSAMAAMARTLGIPARVAVGFTSGSLVDNTQGDGEYIVTTDELHAWPELYFTGVGWVRFEPTVGRANVPDYTPAAVDDPTTPEIDESEVAPQPTQAPEAVDPDTVDAADPTSTETAVEIDWNAVVLALAALVLLGLALVPAFVRAARRRSRLAALDHHGFALGAWDEVRDTALDLRWRLTDAETPREFADRLAVDRGSDLFARTGPVGGSPITGAAALASLERLRRTVERQSFARVGGSAGLGEDARPGEDGGPVNANDARAVLHALRDGVPRRVRIGAALAPASILSRWFSVGAVWRRS